LLLRQHRLQHERALSSGDKPIVSSETGYTTGSPRPSKSGQIPFDVQTKYELRMFAMQFIRGVERTLHYEFCDFADDPGMYGIVAVDPEDPSKLTPKPAYHALYNLIRLLADPGPAFTPTSLSYGQPRPPPPHNLPAISSSLVYVCVRVVTQRWQELLRRSRV
jgi:hypothetical protein